MKVRLALVACVATVALFSGCSFPVKVTGGGTATGLVGDHTTGIVTHTGVQATAAGQARLDQLTDCYDLEDACFAGKGNFQFVETATGMCFHSRITLGGRFPGAVPYLDPWWLDFEDEDFDRLAYGEGWVCYCDSEDGLYDDAYVGVWLYDTGVKGAVKGDRVVVGLASGPGVYEYPYMFDGVLESGNYKIHKLRPAQKQR